MARNFVTANPGAGGPNFATDLDGNGFQWPYAKLAIGVDGTQTPVGVGAPLPVLQNNATATLIDPSGGTGVFPSGGSFTIAAGAITKSLYVQNKDVTAVTVTYTTTSGTSSVVLNPASIAGQGGGTEDRSAINWPLTGTIVVSGTAGHQVTVLYS